MPEPKLPVAPTRHRQPVVRDERGLAPARRERRDPSPVPLPPHRAARATPPPPVAEFDANDTMVSAPPIRVPDVVHPVAAGNVIPFVQRRVNTGTPERAREIAPSTLAAGWNLAGPARAQPAQAAQVQVPSSQQVQQAQASVVVAGVLPVVDNAGPPAPAYPAPAPAPSSYPFAPTSYPSAPAPHAPAAIAAPAAAPASRWAVFEKLGLGPKQDVSQKAAKLMVSAYRLLGFAVLTIIVVVLVGYIFTSAFYFVSDSWIQPVVVSATDEKVLALQAQAAEHENQRDRIAAELRHADREIEVELAYQAEFANAIRADLTGRTAALDRLRGLARDYAGARERIRKSNTAYAAASQRKMTQEYSAGLIDRGDLLSGRFQLAQIANSSLTLAERQAEFETRAEELSNEASALTAILSEQGGEEVLSYEVLRIKQEYDRSRLETAKAIEAREVLKASLERQETMLAGLQQSPYLRAIADHAEVAFVPYGNLHNLGKGTRLYRCSLGMLICRDAGKVLEVLPGEVSHKHPHRDKVLRGQMIEIEIAGSGAREDVLFAGGKPLLF